MPRLLLLVAAVLPLVALAGGCATVRPAISVKHFGSVDPERDLRVSVDATQRSQSPEPTAKVEVVSGSVPRGLDLQERGTKLVVLQEARDRYEIVGEVEASYTPSLQGALWRNAYWTWTNYQQSWRKGVCYPQAPLKLLTLGVWNLVPLAWLCFSGTPSSVTERQIELLRAIKFGAQVMGGNVALVVVEGSTSVLNVIGNQYGATAQVHTQQSTSLKAFVLKQRDASPSPAASSERTAGQPAQLPPEAAAR